MSGGGSKTSTTETLPTWMRPYIESGLKEAENLYKGGQLGHVSGLSPEQQEGLRLSKGAVPGQIDTAEKSAAARDILLRQAAGQEIVPATTGATDALKAKAIRDAQIAARGGYGNPRSSRTGVAQGEHEAALAGQLAGVDYGDLQQRRQAALSAAGGAIDAGQAVQSQYGQPGEALTRIGAIIQEQTQRERDAPWQSLQRRASVIHGAPISPNQVTQRGGK